MNQLLENDDHSSNLLTLFCTPCVDSCVSFPLSNHYLSSSKYTPLSLVVDQSSIPPPPPLLLLLPPKKGSHVGWTLLGTNLLASAANSYKLGQRGSDLNSIPTTCNCSINNDPFRPLHFLQQVTVLSHVNFPPRQRGLT